MNEYYDESDVKLFDYLVKLYLKYLTWNNSNPNLW